MYERLSFTLLCIIIIMNKRMHLVHRYLPFNVFPSHFNQIVRGCQTHLQPVSQSPYANERLSHVYLDQERYSSKWFII